jgi:hypothetical protein
MQLTVSGDSGPFATISKAASLAQPGDTVEITTGTYRETVTPANSGTSTAPITYEPYDGDTVTVSGANLLTGWTLDTGHIYEAPMSFSMGGENDQIFVDGQSMVYARWPNTSLNLSHPTLESAGAGTTGSTTTGSETIVDPNLTQPSGYWTGASIHVGTGPDWLFETATVTSYTPGTLTYTSAYGSDDKPDSPGVPYYLTGHFTDLDAAGEYYYDSTSDTAYLWTPKGDNPSSHTVEAKARLWAFDLSGLSYINLTNLNFFAAGLDSSSTSSHLTLSGITAQYVAYFNNLNGTFGNHTTDNGIILNGTNDTIENSTIAFSSGDGVVALGNDASRCRLQRR